MSNENEFKVLVSDSLAEEGIKIMEEVAQVDVKTGLSEDELVEIIKDYDALVVRSGTQVNERVISAGEKLKVIGRAGVGVDNIDVNKATEKGVLVVNAPEGNTISASEHTMALLLSLVRNIPGASFSLKQSKWDRKSFVGVELYKKTLGIIGLGRIGGEVAKKARAFGMNVWGYDPYISRERAQKIGIVTKSLEDIFAHADIISIHVPASAASKPIIAEAELAKMKDGVRIINCARGGLVDEKALYEALNSGKVSGAALDVFEEEPPEDNPLIKLDNVIATPHLGASTEEAQVNVAVQVADHVVNALKDEPIEMAVNATVLPSDVLTEMVPYIDLMKTMGRFYMQAFDGRVEKLEVIYNGEINDYPLSPLTTALLIGILRVMLNDNVNFVNAPFLAEQRGVKFKEVKSTSRTDYQNLITVNITTSDDTFTIAGTLFEGTEMRIVQIGEYKVDVSPSQYMIVINYIDKPGVIGNIGSILGRNNINIGNMQVGRKHNKGEAIMVVQVDSQVPESVVKELEKVDGIISTCFVEIPQ